MAGTKRPSFLKSQKEQKRKAKAQEKREARQNKRTRAAESATAGGPGSELGTHEPVTEAGHEAGTPEESHESKS
jgi:hypothetical protein